MKKSLILGLMATSMILSGCGMGLATGVGAAVGVSAAKEGGLRGTITDESIRLKISDLWFRKDVNMFSKLSLTVKQGRVLITGVVQKPEDRVEAVRLAWQPEGVKQVINEIRVGEGDTFGTYAEDMWISGQLRTKLTFDKYVQSINYTIDTVQGSVYLMGIAQNQAELDRVIDIAKKIKGVKEVISYVKLAGVEVIKDAPPLYPTESLPQDQMGHSTGDTGMIPPPSDSYPTNDPVPLSGGMGDDMSTYAPPPASSSSSSSIQSEVLPP
ncbi:MAG TPA: BON domain-containing protein [Alphaproteobacteria bacterium]|nr:BON domain-containing protein [Alphaproteobacteria bacterium]HNS43650.1 BON domain-containing protein [Alphaproteobacteria bacterium]